MLFSGISLGSISAFGDNGQNDFISITPDTLNNDPLVAKILENIEKSKKEFSDLQQKSDEEKLIEEQRRITQNMLEQELQRMFKDNEEFTPLASFNKFLKTVSDENTKTVFSGLFDYKEEKVNAARNALHEVLKNGGTLQEARHVYHEAAKIPRTEMIQLVTDLNIQAGFSDPEIQSNFDNNGKLPRYDDDQESVVSFVDLTTSAKNINSSLKPGNQESTSSSDGSNTTSDGSNTTSDGSNTTSDGSNTTSDGSNTTSDGSNTTSDGSNTTSDGSNTTSDGSNTTSDGSNTTSDGSNTTSDGSNTTSDGSNTTSDGSNTTSDGSNTTSDGSNTTSDGSNTTSDGSNTTSDGSNTTSDGSNTTSDGSNTTSDGSNTTSDGSNTTSDGSNTTSDGSNTTSDGSNTTSDGSNTTSDDVLIKKLLEEILMLKNKIKELEKMQNSSIQNTVIEEEKNNSIYYADWISNYSPGLGHELGEIDIRKLIPVNALNAPNSFNDDFNSLALGRDGHITIGFSKPVSDTLIVYETTSDKNLTESAIVEVSMDGQNWITLDKTQYHNDGSFVHEYSYDLSNVGCIEYVKITDTTSGKYRDGFDLDAVGATQPCTDLT